MAPQGGGDGAGAVVCCMCGDHGLPRELFRCSLCRLRRQHRYCSDLYPRAAAYRSCNWCLREEQEAGHGAGGASPSPVKARTTAAKRSLLVTDNNPRADDDDPAAAGDKSKSRPPAACDDGGCSRSAFSADAGKPVKKKKKPNKGNEIIVVRTAGQRSATASKGRREVRDGAGRTARARVKVRRYKLLAEVIC